MAKNSPPNHRHDGSSPLPLGMDWSPPPKKWNGRDTIWPHDSHTGWSYCVTIPSWSIQPESRASDASLVNPIVFYRVQVGVQSPEGISTCRGLLRRFSDFLKLFSALKRTFPKKNLPSAPPKHAFLRINSSRLLLDERRYALEEWMGKLLSDIDVSRSVPVASFLELEAAVRSSFHDVNENTSDENPSGDSMALQFRANFGNSAIAASSSVASKSQSVTPDYGSDNAHETLELGTSQVRDCSSEIGAEDLVMDQDLTAPLALEKYGISDIDDGLLTRDSVMEQLEGFHRQKVHTIKENNVLRRDTIYRNVSKDAFISGDKMEFLSEPEPYNLVVHARKLSSESVGSDISSIRGSELSNTGMTNSVDGSSLHLPGGVGAPATMDVLGSMESQFLSDVQVVLPLDQRLKMNRVLTTMQRRLATAKIDMEDLIARLNQEIAVKEFLTTKVKDLDVELESTKEKSKENLQQAILIERERVTQMQWDMEELRRKSLDMESRLKLEQDDKNRAESAKISAIAEKELLLQELDSTKEQLANLQKRQEEMEMKSKADIKVLVKEVKFLRNSHTELKQDLNKSLKEKAELERIFQKEKQIREQAKAARVKLLHECGILRSRLQECSVNFLAEEEDKFTVDSSSVSDALDLLMTSDNRIGLLLAEAQLLAQDDGNAVGAAVKLKRGEFHGNLNINGDDPRTTDDEVRKTLTDIFIDNARLRKQVNSVIRCALKTVVMSEKDDGDAAPSRKTVLNKFLER